MERGLSIAQQIENRHRVIWRSSNWLMTMGYIVVAWMPRAIGLGWGRTSGPMALCMKDFGKTTTPPDKAA
jgi:hypothetical protein